MKCRFCKNDVKLDFVNLGVMAPANSYVEKKNLNLDNKEYPLRVLVCEKCWLVQTRDFADKKEFFSKDYAYFSSNSSFWLNHAKNYADKIIKKEKLNRKSFVIEVASNDGYLLKNFVKKKIPCLGIEPAINAAKKAENLGILCEKFFLTHKSSNKIVKKYKKADLVIGNNVYAHVPDINDFTKSIEVLLKDEGVVTLEFPHLQNLIKYNQFDTIYHEHFSYLSLNTVQRIFEKNNLKIFKVEELNTHGGSLRIYGCKKKSKRTISSSVIKLSQKEIRFGLEKKETYIKFRKKVDKIKNNLLLLLKKIKKKNKVVVAYGAAAKGNTLLNFCSIKSNLVSAVIDIAPSKQNKYMPSSHIPIYHPDYLKSKKIDFLLILPWNIKDEIMRQNKFLIKSGTKIIIPIPDVKII